MVKSPHVTVLPKSVGKRGSEKHEADTQHTCLQSIWFHSSWNIATAAVHYRTSALDVTCNRTSWWCFVVSLWPHRIGPKEPMMRKYLLLCFPNRRESTTDQYAALTSLSLLANIIGTETRSRYINSNADVQGALSGWPPCRFRWF